MAQTQPVYDLEALEAFVERLGAAPVPLVVGILPLHSFRHAEFLHNEVPGITVPDAVRARLRDAGDHALRVGIETPRRSSRRCAAATPAPTSCRRSADSRSWPRFSRPSGEESGVRPRF